MDRVTNIAWKTTSGATLGGFAYEYDAVGRIVSRDHVIGTNAFSRSYSYDSLDRLASDGGVAYTYDAAGNRMTRTENGATVTYTLGVGDRLASWNGGAYTYDVAGNVTRIERDSRPTLELAWNSQYQLVSVATNGVFAESYSYDALGRRVSTTTLEGTTRHVYDDNWQVVADLDEQDNVIASYTWGDGIDHLLAVKVGGSTYYPLTDIQGTVWGYVDSQNDVVARWQYDAWGNVVDESVSVPALASLRYRFQCREWSSATGLVNFRMRWYDSNAGLWLSKDPIRLMGGYNLLSFCASSPLCYIDPIGLSGVLTICSNAGDGTSLGEDWGHSWITFKKDGAGTEVTFGTWGDVDNPTIRRGLNGNKEKGRNAQSSRCVEIDDEQQRKLLQLLRDYQNKNKDAWSKLCPCSHFASDVWNEITGENLEDRNFIGISLPSKLMESINEANAK